jgi:ABC-type branched-subunit amino acid transport system substrate-binding protein
VTVVALVLGIVVIVTLKLGRAQRTEPSAQARAVAPVTVAALLPPAAPTATPAVRGVTDNEIRFGMAAPFSGPAKELGRQMKMGVEAAFSVVNDAGGIAGRRLVLIAADDGYEPARTVEVMRDLRDKKNVFGFVGNVGTPTAAVALPLALERKMLFFGAFTGADLLRHDPPDRYVFNFRASYTEETAAVVRYLIRVRHLRPESIAVFAQQDAFGDAGFAGVTRAVRELRPDFHGTLRVGYQRNTTDVREAVATVNARSRSTPIKAIVMVATYRAAAHFIEKVRDLFPRMIFTNVSFVGSTALAEELKLLGHRYASGVIVTQVVPPVERFSTAILKYKDALNRYFPGEKADYVSLEGFWVANVLIEGVRRAGHEIDSDRLVDALEGIHDLDLGLGTPLTFDLEEHQASHRVWGTQINDDGVYEELDLR